MKNLVKIALLFLPVAVNAQSNIGIGTNSPDASAQLDISSASKGVLIPRVSLVSVFNSSPVSAPAEGLLVWNTNAATSGGSGKGIYYWNGSQWKGLIEATNAWRLAGNSQVDTSVSFIGSMSGDGLMFRVNNLRAGGIFPVGDNLFLGKGAGQLLKYNTNTGDGERNTLLGSDAGKSEITGRYNTYVGARAGFSSNGSFGNTFIGANAGVNSTTSSNNIGIGVGAGVISGGTRNISVGNGAGAFVNGENNITIGDDVASFIQGGKSNILIGSSAATGNFGLFPKYESYNNVIIGDSAVFRINGATANVIIGKYAGYNSSQGNFNVFVGDSTGINNSTGSQNTYVGSKAKGSASGLQNATAVGANSFVSASNSLVLGSVVGQNGATQHINVGIGTTAPQFGLHVVTNDAQNFGYRQCIMVENVATGSGNTGEAAISFKNQGPDGTGNSQWMIGLNQTRNLSIAYGADFAGGSITKMYIDSTGNVGIGTTAPGEKLEVNGNVKLSGRVLKNSTGSADMLPICYGNISSAGSVTSGSGNFSASRIAAGQYEITINSESHNNTSYVTVITPLSSVARMSSAASNSGKLLVRIFDSSGSQSDTAFYFVVYKP